MWVRPQQRVLLACRVQTAGGWLPASEAGLVVPWGVFGEQQGAVGGLGAAPSSAWDVF